jgi:hypothetical protein
VLACSAQVLGVFKDWIVIVISSVVFNTSVQMMQWVGYSVAFVGILMYTQHKYAQYLQKQATLEIIISTEVETAKDNSMMEEDEGDYGQSGESPVPFIRGNRRKQLFGFWALLEEGGPLLETYLPFSTLVQVLHECEKKVAPVPLK